MEKYFDESLKKEIEKYKDNVMYESISYTLLSGGKRIRPMLVLKLAENLGKDYKQVIDIALAIEFVHNYSLVHDDLPCMDNDLYRRGELTTHAKFGEYMGVLVGDALLTDAFNIISSSTKLKNKSKIIEILTEKIGSKGMILGQVLDMHYSNKDIDEDLIKFIHEKKTTNLIEACFMCVLSEFEINDIKYKKIATNLGAIYQMQDDIFDFENEFDKTNHAKIIGIEKTKKELELKEKEMKKLLENDDILREYINKILNRKY